MDTENTRFWPRVGMYVTMNFAEEWIERMSGSGDEKAGRYLEDDIEEFVETSVVSDEQLRREVKELFENPFEEGELSPEIQAIMVSQQMEANKVNRIKELKKEEGLTTQEAKDRFQEEIDVRISEIMGIEPGSMAIKMGSLDDGEEEESSEASPDGTEEE